MIYASVLVLLVIGIVSIYAYTSSPYYAIVRIGFDVTILAYPQGDYAIAGFDGLSINFTRTASQIGSNPPTEITSYSGQLHKSLSITLNLTLTSATNQVVLPTNDITFTNPGRYTVVFTHLLGNVPRGTYLANLTYTERVFEKYPYQIWTSTLLYFDVE